MFIVLYYLNIWCVLHLCLCSWVNANWILYPKINIACVRQWIPIIWLSLHFCRMSPREISAFILVFLFVPWTEGVAKLLHDLNPNTATGPDDIPARIRQLAANELAPALQIIFQKSLDTCKLPLSWSQANIAPIYTTKIGTFVCSPRIS